ncbi:unnamed protein product, partial [Musa hybrid cultivar]
FPARQIKVLNPQITPTQRETNAGEHNFDGGKKKRSAMERERERDGEYDTQSDLRRDKERRASPSATRIREISGVTTS